jgi:hypothetical protein
MQPIYLRNATLSSWKMNSLMTSPATKIAQVSWFFAQERKPACSTPQEILAR